MHFKTFRNRRNLHHAKLTSAKLQMFKQYYKIQLTNSHVGIGKSKFIKE